MYSDSLNLSELPAPANTGKMCDYFPHPNMFHNEFKSSHDCTKNTSHTIDDLHAINATVEVDWWIFFNIYPHGSFFFNCPELNFNILQNK